MPDVSDVHLRVLSEPGSISKQAIALGAPPPSKKKSADLHPDRQLLLKGIL